MRCSVGIAQDDSNVCFLRGIVFVLYVLSMYFPNSILESTFNIIAKLVTNKGIHFST